MPATALQADLHAMQSEKRRVALNSVFAAFFITALKGAVGLTTGSLGILSEAAHSALDFLAAVITLFSVRVSDQPADADHQYGHGKVENFSAFLETGLLLLTCLWIVWEAVKRLAFQEVHIDATPAAFGVLILSMMVDAWRSRRLGRIARKYDSQALEADALHFSTDIWSSGVVVIGLALVWAGDHYGISWLRKADPVAALVVAGVVVHVSWRLARQTIDALLDAAPKGVRGEILDTVGQVQGVMEVDRVRIRRAGNKYFAEVGVALSRRLTFQRSEQVAAEVTAAVQNVLPHADVTVISIPRASGQENIFDRVRAVASRHNFAVHDVSVQDLEGRLHVEQHLELDERLTLKQAHDVVTRVEAEIKAEVPEIKSILTHIESEPSTIEPGDSIVKDPELERKLRVVAREFPGILDMHEVVLKRVRGLLYLSCHCTLADDTELAKVHDLSTRLEIRFKQEAPELFKVLIHTEPQSDNRR
ncbi:MAG: cation diffusion facilitator family transporter [Acidobacteriales bacterium]|nr:cation diffusion facilitator family transporter [Terriglobales bacterium]